MQKTFFFSVFPRICPFFTPKMLQRKRLRFFSQNKLGFLFVVCKFSVIFAEKFDLLTLLCNYKGYGKNLGRVGDAGKKTRLTIQ